MTVINEVRGEGLAELLTMNRDLGCSSEPIIPWPKPTKMQLTDEERLEAGKTVRSRVKCIWWWEKMSCIHADTFITPLIHNQPWWLQHAEPIAVAAKQQYSWHRNEGERGRKIRCKLRSHLLWLMPIPWHVWGLALRRERVDLQECATFCRSAWLWPRVKEHLALFIFLYNSPHQLSPLCPPPDLVPSAAN